MGAGLALLRNRFISRGRVPGGADAGQPLFRWLGPRFGLDYVAEAAEEAQGGVYQLIFVTLLVEGGFGLLVAAP
jgi:hypothetical protein